MSDIRIVKYGRDSQDGKGRNCPIVYHCFVNGRQKTLSRKSLLEAIETVLPEGDPDVELDTPLLARIENGH